MLKIKKELFKDGFEYELEDGTLLHEREWNGEVYIVDGKNYKPVHEYDEEHDMYNTIGFEEE